MALGLRISNLMDLLSCAFRAWSPQIGDPTVWGWLTVMLYAAAALVAARVAWQAPFPHRTRLTEQVFWACLAVGLAFLTVNKQLDLQSFMTAIARCAAQAQGWYEDRRIVQMLFILGLGLFVLVFGLYFMWLLWGTMRRSLWPLLGAVLICGFVLIRAVGFHHMDILINMRLPGAIRVNFLLEIPGPLIILITGLVLLRAQAGPDAQDGQEVR